MQAKAGPLTSSTNALSSPFAQAGSESLGSAPITIPFASPGSRIDVVPVGIRAVQVPGFIVKYPAGAEIHGEGETATYAYRVVSGGARTFRVLLDGRRQIEGFHFTDDVFSMMLSDKYEESAEAVTDVQVFVMKKSLLDNLIESDPAVSRELLKWTNQSLLRARAQLLLLGRKTALEKVASFLLQLDTLARHADSLVLPMPRSDIADYLGLTIETVSRVLTLLEKDQAIVLTRCRQVRVTCRRRLVFLSGQA